MALLPASMQGLASANVVFRPIAPRPPQVPLYAILRQGDASPTLRHFIAIIHARVGADAGAAVPALTPAPSDRRMIP